jgi:hypothetical protein
VSTGGNPGGAPLAGELLFQGGASWNASRP